MKPKYPLIVLLSGALSLLLAAGCSGQAPQSQPSSSSAGVSASSGASAASSATSSASSQPTWETQQYEDEYLSYEIPANWAKNEEYSSSDLRLAFFTEKDSASAMPSNVNIQVLSLQNRSKDMDYSDPEIQKQYYEFLMSQDSLPLGDAKDITYYTEEIGDRWVYMLSFSRTADDGTEAQQTAYFPMGLDYSLVLWATDFNDGYTPTVDEVAKHICATLTLKS